jgi:hypothetical protein
MASPTEAARESSYGEKSSVPGGAGHKPHHTGSAASGRGDPVGNSNPAFQIKHPNFCPQCGEPLHASPHVMGAGSSAAPIDTAEAMESPAEEAGESPAEEAAENIQEMSGSPALGGKGRRSKTKLKKK